MEAAGAVVSVRAAADAVRAMAPMEVAEVAAARDRVVRAAEATVVAARGSEVETEVAVGAAVVLEEVVEGAARSAKAARLGAVALAVVQKLEEGSD